MYNMQTIHETDQAFLCEVQAPCFQNLTAEEAELIRSSKTQVLFRKGDMLTKQGAFASYILFVVKGLVKQYIEGDGSKSYNLNVVQAGEFVGLSAVFTQNVFTTSTIALTECQAFLIEKDAIARLIKQNGEFGFSLIGRYCKQNANLIDTLQIVLYKQLNGRMADVLLYLDGLKTASSEIFQLLSRRDIAEFAGMSTESAVKLLKNFEKEGLLQLQEKDIVVLNRQALQEISKRG